MEGFNWVFAVSFFVFFMVERLRVWHERMTRLKRAKARANRKAQYQRDFALGQEVAEEARRRYGKK